MKLIKSSEISARILTLLDESYERVILVSPYVKISRWHKLVKKLNELKSRGILPEIYVREGPDNRATYEDLEHLKLPYRKIPNLHTKLYLNEQHGIVTSLNLLIGSEINSLEIGHITETRTEYNELLAYYHRHFHRNEGLFPADKTDSLSSGINTLTENIRDDLLLTCRNSWFWPEGNTLNISTGGNNYRLQIIDERLNISTRLRSASRSGLLHRPPFSSLADKISDLTHMNVSILAESESGACLMSGLSQDKLESTTLNEILLSESACIRKAVVSFIDATDNQHLRKELGMNN